MSQSQETQPISVPVTAVPRPGAAAAPAPAATHRTTRRRRSVGAELWRWARVLLLFPVVATLLLFLSLLAAIYWQARTDEARPVDAIVVMGAAQYDGRPSAVLRARLDRAIAAYEAGLADVILVTGGRQPGDRYTEAEASRAYLLDQGIPAGAILMENEGSDSWESIQGAAAILARDDRERVLIVSDGFHLFRSEVMAREAGLTAFSAPATSSPIRENTGAEFGYVLREAGGLLVFLWTTW